MIRIESELGEYKTRCDSNTFELARNKEELKHLKPKCNELDKHLIRIKQQLEDETLMRVDLENKNSTLKEDLNFKAQLYEKETDQLRMSKRTEIEQVDNRLREDYDTKLMRELGHVRSETENKIKEMKDDVEKRYANKYSGVDTSMKRSQATIDALRDELSSLNARHNDYETDIRNLTLKCTTYETRIREMEDKLKKQSVS